MISNKKRFFYFSASLMIFFISVLLSYMEYNNYLNYEGKISYMLNFFICILSFFIGYNSMYIYIYRTSMEVYGKEYSKIRGSFAIFEFFKVIFCVFMIYFVISGGILFISSSFIFSYGAGFEFCSLIYLVKNRKFI